MMREIFAYPEWRIPIGQKAKCKIDHLLNNHQLDLWFRILLLVQALVTQSKTYAQTGERLEKPAGLRKLIEERQFDKFFREQHQKFIEPFSLQSSLKDLSLFSPGSWVIQFTFTLRKSYISRDDTDFYIIDNPVKKEWVFKVPYVAPSQWKGALRAAMVRQLVEWWQDSDNPDRTPEEFARRRFRQTLLFGDEKGEEPGSLKALARYLDEMGGQEAAQHYRCLVRRYFKADADEPLPHYQGRLHFYPTYFDRIGLEVINPHDRETGAGKWPIYFECVPQDAKGTFTLLYVPLSGDSDNEAQKDLRNVARGIYAMMTTYGFGAKTSSGFGVAKDEVEGGQLLFKEKEGERKRGFSTLRELIDKAKGGSDAF